MSLILQGLLVHTFLLTGSYAHHLNGMTIWLGT